MILVVDIPDVMDGLGDQTQQFVEGEPAAFLTHCHILLLEQSAFPESSMYVTLSSFLQHH